MTYAPQRDITPEEIEKLWVPYMTKECIKRFSTPNLKSEVDPKDVEMDIKYIGFAYGNHQKDSIPRIFAKLNVKTPKRFWEFHLEMRLNGKQKIYEIFAY